MFVDMLVYGNVTKAVSSHMFFPILLLVVTLTTVAGLLNASSASQMTNGERTFLFHCFSIGFQRQNAVCIEIL